MKASPVDQLSSEIRRLKLEVDRVKEHPRTPPESQQRLEEIDVTLNRLQVNAERLKTGEQG